MSEINTREAAPRILIVGGGYAGFYTAFKLQQILAKGEAEVTLVDPLPYLTYQPFLPEVVGGSIEARHVVTSHRKHLRKTKLISGKVTKVDDRMVEVEIATGVKVRVIKATLTDVDTGAAKPAND